MWHVFVRLLVCDLVFCAAFIAYRCYACGIDKEIYNSIVRRLNFVILELNHSLND